MPITSETTEAYLLLSSMKVVQKRCRELSGKRAFPQTTFRSARQLIVIIQRLYYSKIAGMGRQPNALEKLLL